jgi:hypothetical protein
MENSNASPAVKRILNEAKVRLDAEGIDCYSKLTKTQVYEWTKRSAFVKVENSTYRTPMGKANKAPRLIQGASPEFIVLVGPWVMAWQSYIKKKWGINNFATFTSGMSALQVAQKMNVSGAEYLEDDVSVWDASFGVESCADEVQLMSVHGTPQATRQLMHGNVNTRGLSSKGIKYSRPGGRKSGDPYTSVGNSIYNGLYHAFIYQDERKVTFFEMTQQLKMVVQGDDNLLCYPPGAPIKWKSCMLKLGYKADAIPRASLEDCEFCSSRVYETEAGLTFGPKPGRVLSKIGYIIKPPNVHPMSVLRGVALGLLAIAAFVPPVASYANRCVRITEGYEAWFTRDEEWRMKGTRSNLTDVGLAKFCLRHEWTDEMQARLDDSLERWSPGEILDSPEMDWLCDLDTSGPKQF